MTRYLVMPLVVAGSAAFAGCASLGTASAEDRRCSVTDLAELFRNPLRYEGKRFCGRAAAYRHSRVIEVFPEGGLPSDRFDTVLFLSRRADTEVRERLGSAERISIYVEGKVQLQKPCYRVHPEGDTCIPYKRPIDLGVTRLAFP